MTRANLLLIRELNVNGDGDFADVMIQLERPLTPEQKRALRLTRLKQVLDDPDTDSVVELAIHNILGSAAAQSGYDLIEF